MNARRSTYLITLEWNGCFCLCTERLVIRNVQIVTSEGNPAPEGTFLGASYLWLPVTNVDTKYLLLFVRLQRNHHLISCNQSWHWSRRTIYWKYNTINDKKGNLWSWILIHIKIAFPSQRNRCIQKICEIHKPLVFRITRSPNTYHFVG